MFKIKFNMTCLNLSVGSPTKKAYDELVKVFGIEDVAYAVLAQNNGYPLELTPEGKHSLLYEKLINISQVQGNRNKALRLKARIYTPSFIESNGDWLNDKSFKYMWFSEQTFEFFNKFNALTKCNHQCANDKKNIFIQSIIDSYGDNFV